MAENNPIHVLQAQVEKRQVARREYFDTSEEPFTDEQQAHLQELDNLALESLPRLYEARPPRE